MQYFKCTFDFKILYIIFLKPTEQNYTVTLSFPLELVVHGSTKARNTARDTQKIKCITRTFSQVKSFAGRILVDKFLHKHRR